MLEVALLIACIATGTFIGGLGVLLVWRRMARQAVRHSFMVDRPQGKQTPEQVAAMTAALYPRKVD